MRNSVYLKSLFFTRNIIPLYLIRISFTITCKCIEFSSPTFIHETNTLCFSRNSIMKLEPDFRDKSL